MTDPSTETNRLCTAGMSRRELLQRGALLAAPLALAREALAPLEALAGPVAGTAGAPGLRVGPEIYESIGVRPLVNGRGTYTILSGSIMLPEVRAAMEAAAQHYVQLDELADAIGARLAVLTQAEWGMVSSGCSAALTHATAACVAGGNPDLHVRIPHLEGFPRDEVIIPRHSRNVYDAAVRAVGVRVIEVATREELLSAFGPRTAMIYILAGPRADTGPLNTRAVCGLAGERGVPVLVDAAAEVLTVPNVHLGAGASLVGYSGGKCLRGPQTAGLLLGRKDLVRAAWVHSAPHHGFARAMKVGKEEAIGMLMAVEMWMKRDHDAEWKRWTSWLEHIAERARTVDGVTTAIEPPEGLSNRTPSLVVRWDPERLGKDGGEIVARLYDGQPRIAVSRPEGKVAQGLTGIAVNPYMMSAGDERIVADGLVRALREPSPSRQPPERPSADLTGAWDVEIEFAAGKSTHGLFLRQQRDHLEGVHQAEFVSRDLMGSVQGDKVRIHSFYGEERGDSISFTFTGTIVGGSMSGDLSMGEYRDAKWSARRHGSGIV